MVALDAGTEAPPDAGPEDAQADVPVVLPPAETAEEVAARWLESLRRASPSLLATWTRYPFFLHDTGTEGTCGHGAAADAGQLARLLTCLLGNESLLYELRSQPELPALLVKPKDVPIWARRFLEDVPPGAALVRVIMEGRGTSSEFFLVVHDGGVLSLWKQTLFASMGGDAGAPAR